jgi:predicted permease
MTTVPSPRARAFLPGLALDLKATLRGLRRRPAFALTAIITVALGVGACTAMFGAVDAVLLRPLPYATPDRLVAVMPQQFIANRDLDHLRARLTMLDEVAVFSPGWLMPLVGIDEPRQVNAGRLSGNVFSMLGVQPLLGRPFGVEAEEPGRGTVTVLGHDLWRDVFGADSAIIGRSIRLEGSQYTVVAVMPPGFQFLDWQSDLWVPMGMSRDAFTWTGATGLAIGRLRAGATVAVAEAELRTVVPGMVQDFDHPPTWGANGGIATLQDVVVGDVTRMLWFLFGAVVFLLLIASGNVANLLLVRAAGRRGEIALRRSLGAPLARVARLLLAESLILGVAGGIVGALLAVLAMRALPALLPPDVPRLGEIVISGRVFAFAFFATLVPSVAFGMAPLLQAWRGGFGTTLRLATGGAARGERVRGALVSLQVALSLVLLVGASLMGRSLVSLLNVDRGMRTDHLLTAAVMPTGTQGAEGMRAFWRSALPAIEAIPGVVGAATILHLPTGGRTWNADVEVEGRPLPADAVRPRTAWQTVSSGYFATAGIPVVAGRAFTALDVAGAPRVVAVNEAFAERVFPGEDPIGRRIVAGNATVREPATIVAVVGGVRHDSLSAPPAPEVYVPIEQTAVYATALVVRTSVDPASVAEAVKARIWAINPNTPVMDVRTMDDVFAASLQRPRLTLSLLALFAAIGVVLGAVGIYGVVAFGVQQRVRELGIRAALGADAATLRRLVVLGGVRFAVLGVLVGIPVALALSRSLRGMFYGIAAADPVSFVAMPTALVLVAVLASWFPARNAARSDPMAVLRQD